MTREPSASRFDSTAVRFGVAFALVLALKWDTIARPPWWDSAMGLFPGALTLAGNGFDLMALLAMPGYGQGGPDGHSTSPVTFVVALVLRLTGGGSTAFVTLHLMNFAVTAAVLVVLVRLATPLFGRSGAALFGLACLLHPLFSVQAGTMYLEMPLLLAAVCAVQAWLGGHRGRAAVWGTLAVAIKETGLVVPASLAVAAALARGTLGERVRRAAPLLVGPTLWILGTRMLRRVAAARTEDFEYVPSLQAVFGGIPQYVERFLLNVPDLLLWLAVFAIAFTASLPRLWRALRDAEAGGRDGDLVLALTALPVVFFLLLFLVALPAVAGFTIVLPRYFTIVLPFLLLWTGWTVVRLAGPHGRRAGILTWAALAVVFAVNTNGILYPSDVDTEGPGNDHPLSERSNAYRRLQDLQIEAIHALEALPAVPVYYGHHEHYLLQWPGLGYASRPLPDGHNFWTEPLAPLVSAEEFPPCVYALYNYPWLGGRDILGLIRFADGRPDLEVETVLELSDGPYRIMLARIRRVDTDCPA